MNRIFLLLRLLSGPLCDENNHFPDQHGGDGADYNHGIEIPSTVRATDSTTIVTHTAANTASNNLNFFVCIFSSCILFTTFFFAGISNPFLVCGTIYKCDKLTGFSIHVNVTAKSIAVSYFFYRNLNFTKCVPRHSSKTREIKDYFTDIITGNLVTAFLHRLQKLPYK